MSSCNRSTTSAKINSRSKILQGKTDHHIESSAFSRNDKSQQKSDQMRHTSIVDSRINSREDVTCQERIKQVMDLTQRSEDDVIMALHDCDGDLNRAVNDLLEGLSSEWEVKKKKARPSGALKQNPEQAGSSYDNMEWENNQFLRNDRTGRIRGRSNYNTRGWHRRENKENEKNLEDSKSEISYNSSKRGRGISGRSGRGGRGGSRSLGPRTFANRNEMTARSPMQNFTHPIDTWTGNEEQRICKESKMDSWSTVDTNEDWDNEEYTGSLADTKVFTPSILNSEAINDINNENSDDSSIIKPSLSVDLLMHDSQKQSRHRPRVPPPSKIPASAVEMPGDVLNSSISFLDVQFGALEFGSDANINDGLNQDKYNSSGSNSNISNVESNQVSASTSLNSITSMQVDCPQSSSQKFSSSTQLLRSDTSTVSAEHTLHSQSGFTNLKTMTQTVDIQKADLNAQTSLSNPTFKTSTAYQSSKSSYPTSVTTNNYSSYSCTVQANQISFTCPSSNSSNFSTITSVTHANYNSPYTQSSTTTYNHPSPSSSSSPSIYIQTSTNSQGYPTTSAFSATPISHYESQSGSTTKSGSTSFISSGYQNPVTFQSTSQTYQPSITTFTTSMSQGSSAYGNTAHSVYSNSYNNYGCRNQSGSQDHKLSANKDMQFNGSTTTTTNTALVTTVTPSLELTSSSAITSQSKTTVSNAVPKTVSGLVSSNSSNSVTGSGTTGNIAPILSHQYIMGQSVPYATFQQPHMYSYEDLQLMQQRMPHMPTTGYYDATLGYQSTGPVTSLGGSRNDAISSVQGVQGVPTVQGQYTSINDARFTRTDSNASPVSSSISQQTATQHQQPLINPIPPGYAYFYGGGIMPAGSFQYGTPAIYPQIATAGSAGTTNAAYNTKPGNYGSGYGTGANYDSLTNSGSSGDYKSNTTTYAGTQGVKNGSTSGNTNTTGTSSDINATMYAKGHVALNKVNSYDKQTFHSATPPPFGLTNNQNANVISGYGAAHLFIPTVPHQLHQPLHQDSGNNTVQRANTSSQNKAQIKSGYSTSYWAGGN